jgi:hypothetical protein
MAAFYWIGALASLWAADFEGREHFALRAAGWTAIAFSWLMRPEQAP